MDVLLKELINSISDVCEKISISEMQTKFSAILANYEIRPSLFSAGHPDITQKIKIYISARKHENLSDLTLDGYKLELKTFGKYVQKPVEEIKINDIRNYLAQFDHLKVNTLTRKIAVIKYFFQWLVDEEIIIKNPAKQIKRPKQEKRLPKALTIKELEMIRKACITLRERALVEILYATGMRLSELQKMNKEDIDYQNMSARVIGKGNKERFVYFNAKALLHLKKYFLQRSDNDPALFVGEKKPHKRLGNKSIENEIKRIAKRSGVTKNVYPHIFRHSFGTHLLNAGAPLSAIQMMMGHSNPGTTTLYAQLSQQVIKESYDRYFIQEGSV